jgi:hypothetical protein
MQEMPEVVQEVLALSEVALEGQEELEEGQVVSALVPWWMRS